MVNECLLDQCIVRYFQHGNGHEHSVETTELFREKRELSRAEVYL